MFSYFKLYPERSTASERILLRRNSIYHAITARPRIAFAPADRIASPRLRRIECRKATTTRSLARHGTRWCDALRPKIVFSQGRLMAAIYFQKHEKMDQSKCFNHFFVLQQ